VRKSELLLRKSAHILCTVDAETATPRARAALAYSGLTQEQLADRIGMKRHTLRGFLGPANKADLDIGLLYKIAEATGVPRRFMDEGFEPDAADRLADLERTVSDLSDRLRALGARQTTDVAAILRRIDDITQPNEDSRSQPQP
jgi:transcriptional regulator with XRE-family HTH domain